MPIKLSVYNSNKLELLTMKQPNPKDNIAKKNIRQYYHNAKALKRQTCRAFEQNFSQNPEFDSYIKSEFQKMIQQRSTNPSLIIPSSFKIFIHSKSFKQLIKKLYIYTDAMLDFDRKYEDTQKQGFNPHSIRMLRHETKVLEDKCKQISYVYMGILLSYGDSQAIFKDQYFFETMMYFIAKVLKGNFQEAQFYKVDQELNRIFRTDAFNLIKRRHEEDQIYSKYPVLKEVKYESTERSVNHLMKRLSIQKKHNYSMNIRLERPKRLIKPIDISLSTFKSSRSRSPLIASFYPGYKQKLFGFSQAVREKDTFIKSVYKRTFCSFQNS